MQQQTTSLSYKEQFQKNCFQPALEELLRQTDKMLEREPEKVVAQFIKPLTSFLNQLEGQAAWISLSLLRLSVCQGKTVILAEAYREQPFLEAPLLEQEMSAEWMFSCLTDYRKQIELRIQEEVLGRYIRQPELSSWEQKAVSTLLRYLFYYIKYTIRNLEDEEVWQHYQQKEQFTISFGEYMDWQLPILVVKPQIDIFLCNDIDLTYRSFQEMYYEGKQFQAWTLDDSVFEKCSFRNVVFKETSLRDVRFLNCRFYNCQFEATLLMGATFHNCDFEQTDFTHCKIQEGWQPLKNGWVYYGQAVFKGCTMKRTKWEETEWNTTDYCRTEEFPMQFI